MRNKRIRFYALHQNQLLSEELFSTVRFVSKKLSVLSVSAFSEFEI